MNVRLVNYALVAGALLYSVAAQAQTTEPDSTRCTDRIELSSGFALSDAHRSLLRALTITAQPEQSGLFRATSLPMTACAAGLPFLDAWRYRLRHARVDILPIQGSVFSNSAYPRTVDDGAAWRGVGLNLAASAGVAGHWRFINARLSPEIYYQQNKDFLYVHNTVPQRTEFASPYHNGIDYPTRFGTKAFTTIVPGQSYVQAIAGPASVTLSTENLWMGPAEVYPILMSYTAPGFPHVRLGTQRPVDVGIGWLEVQLLFASLHESDYFDFSSANDHHYFTSTMLVLEPKFVRGLYLGFARVYHDTAQATRQSIGYYVKHLIETPFGGPENQGNLVGNGLGELMARWVLPQSGFEMYVEWSREDTPGGWLDLLREPDWTQAYVLGFQKSFKKPNRLVRLYGELNHLGESAPARGGRGFFSYYNHHTVVQGHTNEGQLLGAAIGPGSDAQLLGADIFSAHGRTALRVERTRYDDDTYYRTFARRYTETRHDAEITLSASRLQMVRGFEVEGGIDFSRRWGRQFINLGGFDQPDMIENNLGLRLSVSWNPSF